MKRYTPFLLFLILTLVADSAFSQENCPGGVCPIPQQQETASLDAVVRVRTIVSERSSSLGSGAIVQWGGATVILTAEHVIRGARDARAVSVRIGGEYRRVPVYYIDNVCDFAILGLPEKCRIPQPLQLGVPRELPSGTPLYAIGFGGDGKKCRTTAYFQRYYSPKGSHNDGMIILGGVIQGDSGGPIVTPNNTVIGVLWGTDQKSTYCTLSRRIAEKVESLRLVAIDGENAQAMETQCPGGYVDPARCPGNFCGPRTPADPGYRQPILESPPILTRPEPPTMAAPILSPLSPNISVTVPPQQDQAVVAGWLGDLNQKVDLYEQRLNATEQAVGAAIGEAREIVKTTNGRLTTLETQTLLAAKDREKLPETIAAGANDVFASKYPVICLLALGVCVAVLLFRRFLDRRDGQLDGVVDVRGLYQRRRARLDALDGSIDFDYPIGYSPTDRYYGRPSDIARAASPVVVVPPVQVATEDQTISRTR